METPAGTPIKEGLDTTTVDFRKLFPTLRDHHLTGYMAVDILTNNGIEEGILLYNEGEIIAAEYEYLAQGETVSGEDALKLIMNACTGKGTFDVYEIPKTGIMEIREKNRANVLKYKPTNEEIFGYIPDSFTENKVGEKKSAAVKAEEIKAGGEISREDVLKKYGISHPDERMLDTLLKDIS